MQRLRKQGTNHLWIIETDGVALISAHVGVLRVWGSTKTGGLSEVTCKQRIAVLSTILYDKQWWLSKLSIKVKVSLWWTENNTKNFPNFVCAVLCLVTSVVSNCLQPHGLLCPWLLCPWDSPGKNTEVGWHFLLQGTFPTQESNPGQVDSLLYKPPGNTNNTGVGSLSLLEGNFLTEESNWGLLRCRQILYQLSYPSLLNFTIKLFDFYSLVRLSFLKSVL